MSLRHAGSSVNCLAETPWNKGVWSHTGAYTRVSASTNKMDIVALATRNVEVNSGELGKRSKSLHFKLSSRAKNSVRNLITERKFISILRADLHQSSALITPLDVEDAVARLRPALEEMRSAVHQFGGVVYRELGDGIFAVFGAPASDDLHAVMACFAALDLLHRIETLGDKDFRVRIGVHSGLVIAGPRQLDYTKSYDFEGPSLILAERLQSAAEPGRALVSETCFRLADGYIRFGLEKTLTLKGFAQPVKVYPIEGAGEPSKWRIVLNRGTAAFVGRETEMAQLTALALGKTEAGCSALVSGEPGVGKSRLAREVMQALRLQGRRAIGTECSPIVGQAPFSLLRGILVAALAALGPAEAIGLDAELSAAQRVGKKIIVEGAAVDGFPDWLKLAPRARGRAIIDMACAVMRRFTSGEPSVLLIEDAQWADEASTPAIEAILGLLDHAPLFVLVTSRTGGLPSWTERIGDLRLALAPLEQDAALAMLNQLLGPSAGLKPLKDSILTHTGAMPLFIEEVCRELIDSGRLTGSRGEYGPSAEDLRLDVPLTVQGVIASRIDRLGAPEKRLLQVAAAIGPKAPSPLLRALSKSTITAFHSMLSALVSVGMLTSSPEPGSTELWFPHEFVRQVAYDATLESDRIRLHKLILDQLEAEAASSGEGLSTEDIRIHHAVRAREWARAAELATSVARKCFSQSAFSDARRHYELAMSSIDKLPPSPTREGIAIDLRIEARMAYGNLGLVSRWLDLAKEAEARALAAGDQLRRIPALAVRAAALNFCGTPSEAIETGEAAVREATRVGEAGWAAYAEYGLGQARFVAGSYHEAVESLERAYRRFKFEGAAPPVGASAAQAALLSCMMTCLSQVALGDTAAAEAAQQRADAISAKIRTPTATIAAGLSRGILLIARDELGDAESTLAQALLLAQRHEVNLFVPVLSNPHGMALLQLGEIKKAREAFETAQREAESLGHRSASLRAELGRSLCDALSRSGLASALETLNRCLLSARQAGYRPVELEALLVKRALLQSRDEFDALCNSVDHLVADMDAVGTLRDTSRMLKRLFHSATPGTEFKFLEANCTEGVNNVRK